MGVSAQSMSAPTKPITEAIDLFCGIGGLTCGLQQANIDVIAGLDNDEHCRYAYTENNNSPFICADIAEYDFQKMKGMYSNNSTKVLVGCAPCQPFTPYARNVVNKQNTMREGLIEHFLRAIKVIEPDIISMENVRGLKQRPIFKDFVKNIEDWGYTVKYEVVYCPDYGVPQSRYRLVLMASKLGELNVPAPDRSKREISTVKNAIGEGKLPELKDGETCPTDPAHICRKLAEINKKRIKQSKPQGTWHDWDKDLLPDCYKKQSGQQYTNVYGRMSWDHVGPTITTKFLTYSTGRFGHPEQDRTISLREASLLQTFPKTYNFGKDFSLTMCEAHIGNAVPPLLGKAIGNAIQLHIKSKKEQS